MAHKIQIKRGSKADLPTLNDGELGLCLDTNEVYVGNNGTNVPVGVQTEIVNNLTTTTTGSALDATQGKTLAEQISTHTGSISNPHGVTAVQIGAFGSLGANMVTDINNFTSTGCITLNTAVSNQPSGSSQYASVWNMSNNGVYISQYWFDAVSKRTYIRHNVDSVWAPWMLNYDSRCVTISTSAPSSALAEGIIHMVY